ncbi:hypothetical protein [Leptolyngbya sp. KIOST-1]|uniref:hypothetical protein n=1 Tax=Leptolyngbya sp. KIOST-1 TaxID=1229172 RepID=UPI0005651C07|nr:hypothetical protein [Leptolyngbya sp. KIOST-1]
MPPEEPRWRSYNERLLHKAALAALPALIAAHPDWNNTAIAMRAIELAQALVKELKFIEVPTND